MMFWRKDKKAELQGHKEVTLKGQTFIIRKINPLMDFPPERMPQIFSHWQSRRRAEAPMDESRAMKDMMAVVEAGVVGIKTGRDVLPLVEVGKGGARGREPGLTVEDIFRDQEVGVSLYLEIFQHTLNRFSGLRKVFFSLQSKLLWFTLLRKSTACLPIQSPFQKAG